MILVSLIDFAQPSNNEFLVVNQFTVAGTRQPRKPDWWCSSTACRWR